MSELLPCPFCGSEAYSTYSTQNTHGLKQSFAVCKNIKCGATIKEWGEEEIVVGLWNHRTPPIAPSVPDDLNESERAELERLRNGYEPRPNKVSFWFMYDGHTFARLDGNSLDEILDKADKIALSRDGRCGMLCSPILLCNDKEKRRLKLNAFAPCCSDCTERWEKEKAAWRTECENDADVMRLITAAPRNEGENG